MTVAALFAFISVESEEEDEFPKEGCMTGSRNEKANCYVTTYVVDFLLINSDTFKHEN